MCTISTCSETAWIIPFSYLTKDAQSIKMFFGPATHSNVYCFELFAQGLKERRGELQNLHSFSLISLSHFPGGH